MFQFLHLVFFVGFINRFGELFKIINPYLFTGYINSYLSAFHDPIPYGAILRLILICFLWTGIFLALAFNHFIKKDITD